MSSKFHPLKIGEYFAIDKTPKPVNPVDKPKVVYQWNRKASHISYVDLAETFLGEIGYDPDIEPKIVTMEEARAAGAVVPGSAKPVSSAALVAAAAPAAPALKPVKVSAKVPAKVPDKKAPKKATKKKKK